MGNFIIIIEWIEIILLHYNSLNFHNRALFNDNEPTKSKQHQQNDFNSIYRTLLTIVSFLLSYLSK